MTQILTVSTLTWILFGLVSIYSLSISNLTPYVNSITDYDNNEKPHVSYYPDRSTTTPDTQIGITTVEFVKSFKNSSGFYKINGTLENQGAVILSEFEVIKYYKVPSLNDTTLICYEQDIVNCQYKSVNNNQLPAKDFFLTMPPAPVSNIESN